MRDRICFYRRGRLVERADLAPDSTLLDHLRLDERATGTKEGCAEGDCGACTVVLRRLREGRVVYEPINACILLAGQADGAEVITVEDLADGELHPVQRALVEHHGSQCGFCTPGFVMATRAFLNKHPKATLEEIQKGLGGNLCRCGTYQGITQCALELVKKGGA
jgi:xanthine dehydrogenase small subunit